MAKVNIVSKTKVELKEIRDNHFFIDEGDLFMRLRVEPPTLTGGDSDIVIVLCMETHKEQVFRPERSVIKVESNDIEIRVTGRIF